MYVQHGCRRAAICPWKLHLFKPHIVFEWQEHHEHRVRSLQEYAVNTVKNLPQRQLPRRAFAGHLQLA